MLRVLRSKFRHSWGRLAVLFMVLLLATVFLDTSVQLFIQSIQSAKIIEENTTTLAIEQIVYEIQEVYGQQQVVPVIYGNEAMNKAKKSSAVIDANETNTLVARGEGLMPVFPNRAAQANGATTQMRSEKVAVFRVRCITEQAELSPFFDETQNFYYLTMQVLDAPVLHPGFYIPNKITIRGVCYADNPTIPFELGKDYLVAGCYDEWAVFEDFNSIGKRIYTHLGEAGEYILDVGFGTFQVEIPQYADCAAVMDADDPRAENLLNIARFNTELFMVTGVNQMEGIPIFAMNDAYLAKGRTFSREEVKNGDRVCLISTAFANANKIALGDQIDLTLYKHNIMNDTWNYGRIYQIPYTARILPIAQQDSFTVIGIYQTKEWAANKFAFPPSTVFVPLDSLTAQGRKGVDFADCLILENGSNEQFLQDMRDAGLKDGAYTVYDGGYVQYMQSLQTMRKDTALVMAVCLLLYLVIAAASLSMMVQHLKMDAEMMLRVGADDGYARRYMLLCILPIAILASVCAYAIGCMIHVPLMGLIEKWYAVIRPKFSNLPSDAQGMLTANMAAVPLPVGVAAGWLISMMITWRLVCSRLERRKN